MLHTYRQEVDLRFNAACRALRLDPRMVLVRLRQRWLSALRERVVGAMIEEADRIKRKVGAHMPRAKTVKKDVEIEAEIEDLDLENLDLEDSDLDLGDLEGEITLDDVEEVLAQSAGQELVPAPIGDSASTSLLMEELAKLRSDQNDANDTLAAAIKGLTSVVDAYQQTTAELLKEVLEAIKAIKAPAPAAPAAPTSSLTEAQKAQLIKLAKANKKPYPVGAFSSAVADRVKAPVPEVQSFYEASGMCANGKMIVAG